MTARAVDVAATFTWLDGDDEEERRIREALKALETPGMIDPLGFGVARDAFSDLLFPGISTIQTRARYFLFVPWIMQELDASSVSGGAAIPRARELELGLLDRLDTACPKSERGIIGRQSSRPPNMQLASTVYWGGLSTFGIRLFDGSRRDYLLSIDERRKESRRRHDHEAAVEPGAWHPDLPPPATDFNDGTTLALEPEEARFLARRITTSSASRDSFFASVVRHEPPTLPKEGPWTGAALASATDEHRRQLRHAELFSLVTWGANIRYNTFLAERYDTDGTEMGGPDIGHLVGAWQVQMRAKATALRAWEREWPDMWHMLGAQNPNVARTVEFIEWWMRAAIADPSGVQSSPSVAVKLRDRELLLKPGRSRLADARCRRPGEGPQGHDRMLFRWPQARQIALDIFGGLA